MIHSDLEMKVISGDSEAQVEYVARAICWAFPTCEYCIKAGRCLATTEQLKITPQWEVATEFRAAMASKSKKGIRP